MANKAPELSDEHKQEADLNLPSTLPELNT